LMLEMEKKVMTDFFSILYKSGICSAEFISPWLQNNNTVHSF